MIKPNNKRHYRVRCKSGLIGSRRRLQSTYLNFKEFKRFSVNFSLAKRLGYRSVKAAWAANPVIEGSVEPSDFRKVCN